MTDDTIKINRAPVLTPWAAVVAERLGFDRDEALTLGRAVAGYRADRPARCLLQRLCGVASAITALSPSGFKLKTR